MPISHETVLYKSFIIQRGFIFNLRERERKRGKDKVTQPGYF